MSTISENKSTIAQTVKNHTKLSETAKLSKVFNDVVKMQENPQHIANQTSLVLGVGSYGSEVEQLQLQLQQKGFYEGTIDKIFGEATKHAVRAFQATDDRLFIDGVAGPETIKALFDERENITRKITEQPSLVLDIGSNGPEVGELQARLKEKNLYNGKIDHVYGKQTAAAVSNFQATQQGLEVNGIADFDTILALFDIKQQQANEATIEVLRKNLKTLGLGFSEVLVNRIIEGRRDYPLEALAKTITDHVEYNIDKLVNDETTDHQQVFKKIGLRADVAEVASTIIDKLSNTEKDKTIQDLYKQVFNIFLSGYPELPDPDSNLLGGGMAGGLEALTAYQKTL